MGMILEKTVPCGRNMISGFIGMELKEYRK